MPRFSNKYATEARELLKRLRREQGMSFLSKEEKEFVRNVRDRDIPRGKVSLKQIRWLRNIVDPFETDDDMWADLATDMWAD